MTATATLATIGRGTPSPPARHRRTDLRVALVFIAPALIGLIAFSIIPTFRGLYLSFTEYSVLGDPEWVGTANFEAIARDPLFWNALVVTSEYVVINIVVQTTVATGLALLMHRVTRSTLVRGLLLLPYLMANVIAAMLWFWMLDYNIGIVNQLIEWAGLPRVAFFGSQEWAIPTQALINTWRHVGYTALLIFAGLQSIPATVYEAARLDGAGAWSTFWRITMPLLRPVLALVLVTTVTGSFQVFDTVNVTTGGGPVNATRVLQVYIFQRAFTQQEFGYGSALAVVLFVILAIVAFFQMKFLRGNESDLA
ncbi:carbohydrate ABC transporter permease [Microbacterium stercoris]|uniref:Sugar ABC transporter permease n=1 Tax=Microbacterium stercoris TaxID=2820289 RepID=A0A939QHS4_9MICO|nr:sugar ABC transporter permease [Microbacterium stercoris]MBO3663172.1 sugar ABC transporter permease [Microbacterium stercoris]